MNQQVGDRCSADDGLGAGTYVEMMLEQEV